MHLSAMDSAGLRALLASVDSAGGWVGHLIERLSILEVPSSFQFSEYVRRRPSDVLPERIVVESHFRVWRCGDKYRLERPDGLPIIIYDGSTRWNFSLQPADTMFIATDLELTARRHDDVPSQAFPYDLPPRPRHERISDDFEPLGGIDPVQINGREAWRYTVPVQPGSAHKTQAGSTFIVDATSGWVIREYYAHGGGVEGIEWTSVRHIPECDPKLFSWNGPERTRAEFLSALESSR